MAWSTFPRFALEAVMLKLRVLFVEMVAVTWTGTSTRVPVTEATKPWPLMAEKERVLRVTWETGWMGPTICGSESGRKSQGRNQAR